MLEIAFTSQMKRNAKMMQRRGKDMDKLITVLDLLASKQVLSPQYRDHPLKGEYQDFRECHLEPDWLLIYRIIEDKLILLASGTGTHSDLFDG